jgi:hypothetical protein
MDASVSTVCDSLFGIIPSLNALVCQTCKFVVPRDHLAAHLSRHKAHTLSQSATNAILAKVNERYPMLVTSAHDVFRLPFSLPPQSRPLPYLPLLTGYYQCSFMEYAKANLPNNKEEGPCVFACANRGDMQRHCKHAHGWSFGRGRISREKQRAAIPWIEGVTCQ